MASDDEARKAVEMANLHDVIMNIPKQWNTQWGMWIKVVRCTYASSAKCTIRKQLSDVICIVYCREQFNNFTYLINNY